MPGAHPVLIRVVHGDVLEIKADVLALKYAQSLYGADRSVYRQFTDSGRAIHLPPQGRHVLVESAGVLPAARVLYVGVAGLQELDYLGIRNFARRVLTILATEDSGVEHLALTLHGANFGLDEREAFESEVAGLLEALSANACPASLRRISVVELSRARAGSLEKALDALLPRGEEGWHLLSPSQIPADTALRVAGQLSEAKRHVFVAMPFVESMDDIFHYGIESAVKAAGLLCERADLSIFAGDIMERVRRRIETATLVVADLTAANPNVYLEVGYAWGRGVPTVLLSKDASDLTFDVRGHRCLIYKNIRQLEEKLTKELKALATA